MIDTLKKQITSGRLSFKSVTAIVLFGAIILVFVFFGMPSNSGGIGSAARVNNTLISIADLRSESAQVEQMYSQFMGGALGGEAQRQFIQRQALDQLINRELVSQSAQKAGILTTDAEVRDVIVNEVPAFQQNGRFQREIYMLTLSQNQLKPGDFEEKVRKQQSYRRTVLLFQAASQPLNLEVEKLKKLNGHKLNVAFAHIEKDEVLGTMKVPESTLAANKANADFMKKVTEYYNTNKDEFATPAEFRASHILIKVDPADPQSEAQALAKINDLKKRAAKEDFAKLAKEFSDDAGSKAKGGDLGTFSEGRMVPEFENAVKSQPVGAVGEPVKSAFGYHLIKVVERKDARQPELAQVQDKIVQKLSATALYDGVMNDLEGALGKKDQAAVDATLAKLGVKWDETGFFDLGAEMVPKLGSAVASRAALEVTKDTPLLPRLVRDGADRFVIRYKEEKVEAPAAVDQLQAQLARQYSSDTFGQWLEQEKKKATIDVNSRVMGSAL